MILTVFGSMGRRATAAAPRAPGTRSNRIATVHAPVACSGTGPLPDSSTCPAWAGELGWGRRRRGGPAGRCVRRPGRRGAGLRTARAECGTGCELAAVAVVVLSPSAAFLSWTMLSAWPRATVASPWRTSSPGASALATSTRRSPVPRPPRTAGPLKGGSSGPQSAAPLPTAPAAPTMDEHAAGGGGDAQVRRAGKRRAALREVRARQVSSSGWSALSREAIWAAAPPAGVQQ
jgi:hypothetical protein